MSYPFSTASLRKIFSFPFRDPNWLVKMFILVGLTVASFIIPILPGLVIAGYCLEIMRRIIVGKEEPSLPEWDDWGRLLGSGLRMLGVSFIYMLPFSLVIFICIGLVFVSTFSFPLILGSNPQAREGIVFLFIEMAVFVVVGILILVSSIGSVAAGLFLPVAMGRMAEQGTFKSAFEIKQWWKVLRANLGGYALAFLLLLGCYMIYMFAVQFLYLSLVLCCLMPVVILCFSAYAAPVASALYASVYSEGQDRLSEKGGA